MKNRIQIYILFFTTAFISSCKKEASAPSLNDIPVVQAYLKVGSTDSITISRLIAMDANAQYSSDDINALTVTISANSIAYPLSSIGGGIYVNNALTINDSTTYSLHFNYNGKTVTASTMAPSKPKNCTQSVTAIYIAQRNAAGQVTTTTGLPVVQPDPVTLTWSNPDHSYYLVSVQNAETNPELINLTDVSQPVRLFRSEPTQDISTLISSRQFHYYGMHKLTIYHILSDYADLYKNNGTSSQNLTTPASSVTNGLGIFTAVNSAVLYINVQKQ